MMEKTNKGQENVEILCIMSISETDPTDLTVDSYAQAHLGER